MFFAIQVLARFTSSRASSAGVHCLLGVHVQRRPAPRSPVTLHSTTVVVTATRVADAAGRGHRADVVIDRDTIERSGANDAAELLRFHAGLDLGRNGGPGQPDGAVHSRRREQPHAGPGRRRPHQSGHDRPARAAEHLARHDRAHRGRQGPTLGALGHGRDRRRDQRDHATRLARRLVDRSRLRRLRHAQGQPERRLRRRLERRPSISAFRGSTAKDSRPATVRRRRSRLRQPEREPAGALRRRTGATGLAALAYRRALPSTRIFSWRRSTRTSNRRRRPRRSCFPLRRAANARVTLSHFEDRDRAEPVDRFPAHGSRLARRASTTGRSTPPTCSGSAPWCRARKRAACRSATAFDADTRYDHVSTCRIAWHAGRHSALLALGYTDHETAGDAVTWNVEYAFDVTPQTRVFALTGSGFRAPDATDRFGFGGNPDLDPEQFAQLRGRRAPRVDAAAVTEGLRVPDRHRRPHRFHGALVRPVRGREPERRGSAHPRHRGRLGLYGRALERACRSDLPGSAQPRRTTRCCCAARRKA